MSKWLYVLLCTMIPALASAADSGSSLSFVPPAGDYSMVFLGNLFGTVDGVLHGTGSQIMGNMFGVFNSAVLALGGIIIMYTIMVSTMNTAHEGQFLGQKWSSIWIPVRSTLGLALIIPKASGYCLMQLFVMWMVVQGVGAADKVWDSALSYLNRGGVIVKAQQGSPATVAGQINPALDGAYTMLVGQVCMGILQQQLKTTRDGYLNAKSKKLGGACDDTVIKNKPDMKKFCDNSVPDFSSSVNFMEAQEGASPYQVKMPNFSNTSPYADLNGICGSIEWTRFGDIDDSECKGEMGGVVPADAMRSSNPRPKMNCGMLSQAESDTLAKARPIALTAMYNDLSNLAQVIVNNIPLAVNTNETTLKKVPFSPIATMQFGIPFTEKGLPCEKYSDGCVGWGAIAGSNSAPLFSSGAEFTYAVLDYNNVMLPNLNLVQQLRNAKTTDQARAFIAKANQQGWIMAGTYFFDLAKLNGDAASNIGLIDLTSGLSRKGLFKPEDINAAFTDTGCGANKFAILCTWLGNASKIKPLLGIINGSGYMAQQVAAPEFKVGLTSVTVTGKESSTVNGYVQNSSFIQLPGQPGIGSMSFAKFPEFSLTTKITPLPEIPFDCGWVLFGCLGRVLGDFFWNKVVMGIYAAFVQMLAPIITTMVNTFILIPLQTLSGIFVEGLTTLAQPGTNPIIALANMGAHYINSAGDMWLNMLLLSISTSVIPLIGKFVFVLITLSMPIVVAWLGLMMGVGFVTSYYVPMLPFLIFTFASIGWLIAVIEAMVAAPIVALGITHPEGHDAFGKGEQAVMILMNVFLRPAMMIIGYIAAIALWYVGVWLLNAGFQHAIGFIVGVRDPIIPMTHIGDGSPMAKILPAADSGADTGVQADNSSSYGYGATWAGVYAFFFSILIYTSAYLTIVQKAFTLIHYLPDKVLRWIGGQPEGIGAETAGWADETKGQIKEAGDKTGAAHGKIGEKLGSYGEKAVEKGKQMAEQAAMAGAGGVSEEPPAKSTPKKKDDDEDN